MGIVAVTLTVFVITVVSAILAILAAKRATDLRYALFEDFTPYATRLMQRNYRTAVILWVATGCLTFAGTLVVLGGVWQIFMPRGPIALLIMEGAWLVLAVLWGAIMVGACKAFARREKWRFFGDQ